MEWFLNNLPVLILALTFGLAIFEKIIKKKESNWLTWIMVILIILSGAGQIILNIFNKTQSEKAKVEEKMLRLKSDSLTNVIIFKEDGIKTFIESYLLNDSINKKKYESINKIKIEQDRPQVVMFDPKLIKSKKLNGHITQYTFINNGQRPADNLQIKEYAFIWNDESLQFVGSATLALNKNLIFSKENTIQCGGHMIWRFSPTDFNKSIYFYLNGSYYDLITKKKYPLNLIYVVPNETNNSDTINLVFGKGWMVDKIESYLKIKKGQ